MVGIAFGTQAGTGCHLSNVVFTKSWANGSCYSLTTIHFLHLHVAFCSDVMFDIYFIFCFSYSIYIMLQHAQQRLYILSAQCSWGRLPIFRKGSALRQLESSNWTLACDGSTASTYRHWASMIRQGMRKRSWGSYQLNCNFPQDHINVLSVTY